MSSPTHALQSGLPRRAAKIVLIIGFIATSAGCGGSGGGSEPLPPGSIAEYQGRMAGTFVLTHFDLTNVRPWVIYQEPAAQHYILWDTLVVDSAGAYLTWYAHEVLTPYGRDTTIEQATGTFSVVNAAMFFTSTPGSPLSGSGGASSSGNRLDITSSSDADYGNHNWRFARVAP